MVKPHDRYALGGVGSRTGVSDHAITLAVPRPTLRPRASTPAVPPPQIPVRCHFRARVRRHSAGAESPQRFSSPRLPPPAQPASDPAANQSSAIRPRRWKSLPAHSVSLERPLATRRAVLHTLPASVEYVG